MDGIIIKAISGFYYIYSDGEIYECKARGNFKKSEITPTVGDKASFSLTDKNKGVIEKLFDRKNCLERPTIANIDKLFIVSSYSTPSPDSLMIDRLTAICEFNNIDPIIVFNKSDMGDFSEWKSIYEKAGYKTYVVCAKTGEGIEYIRTELTGVISAFAGNSGVGKSSILNAVFGSLELKTGDVSNKLGRGRHTTRHTELYRHNLDGFVADTPGFSSLNSISTTFDFKTHLPECFREFNDYLGRCRFNSCTHTCEKDCAVIEAVKKSDICESRHQSYVKIFEELKDLREWESLKNKVR